MHQLENKINGGFTDLATLCDAYNNIKEKNGIEDLFKAKWYLNRLISECENDLSDKNIDI